MTTLFSSHDEPARYIQVVPERAIDTAPAGLTYALPDPKAHIEIGDRVTVPLGRGNASSPGFVVAIDVKPDIDPDRIKPIRGIDAHGIGLNHELLSLGQWIAGYYCCPLGSVFSTMLPAAVKRLGHADLCRSA